MGCKVVLELFPCFQGVWSPLLCQQGRDAEGIRALLLLQVTSPGIKVVKILNWGILISPELGKMELLNQFLKAPTTRRSLWCLFGIAGAFCSQQCLEQQGFGEGECVWIRAAGHAQGMFGNAVHLWQSHFSSRLGPELPYLTCCWIWENCQCGVTFISCPSHPCSVIPCHVHLAGLKKPTQGCWSQSGSGFVGSSILREAGNLPEQLL